MGKMNRSMKQLEHVGLVQDHSSIQEFSATLKGKKNGNTNTPQVTTVELESVLTGCNFVTKRHHIMFLARAEK